MPSVIPVISCAAVALVIWGCVGWLIARRVFAGSKLAFALAPTLGWAIQNTIALALALGLGFSAIVSLAATSAVAFVALTSPKGAHEGKSSIPAAVFLCAALLALLPAVALLPKFAADGIQFAGPIFDHSKVALIAEIARSGVAPANPVFAEGGAGGSVSYYYLWHFGAAELAKLTGATAWEADIASSWFTGFASLMLVGGLALELGRRISGALLAIGFCCVASLRVPLAWLVGQSPLDQVLRRQTGLAGWLLETSWSPHHVMSAGCTVTALLLLVRIAQRPNLTLMAVLAIVVSAGFQSSLWVGGIMFALMGPMGAVLLILELEPAKRRGFLIGALVAAAAAIALSFPLIIEQVKAAEAHAGALPVTIGPYRVFGAALSAGLHRVLDAPAYWLIFLEIELPIAFIIGGISLWRLLRTKTQTTETKLTVRVVAIAALISLLGGWLLVSTLGINNDLGWRAVLPAIIILNATAGVAVSDWLGRRRWGPIAGFTVLLLLAAPDTVRLIDSNFTGSPQSRSSVFVDGPEMWAAVRRHASFQDRVANNPLFLENLTPWPINLSWALLADRRSCFAGNELALALTNLSVEQRQTISDLFIRVFAGDGTEDDIAEIARHYGCRVALVTAEDGAWDRDPFAKSSLYRLAETRAGKWRIYVAADPPE
jgi:hypothetical protein